ncbi:hypothetical protein AB0L65_45380 [Nonomuraea sp. NPDC052116]|uniref:hypothetical protein n=1 Tax=Nonomuraea sp. NPDC052116 TaxID=3155665 RepID=UPI00343FBCE8
MADIARTCRILDRDAAQDAINAALGQGVQDDEHRVRIEAHVQLRVPKSEKTVALQRIDEETAIRTAHARETVELDLLLSRLTDPALGPVWWVTRYADLQFAAGDPEKKIKSVLAAFNELRNVLHSAEVDRTPDLQLLVRLKIHEVFSAIQDERSLLFAMELMNRILDHMGVRQYENTTGLNGGKK